MKISHLQYRKLPKLLFLKPCGFYKYHHLYYPNFRISITERIYVLYEYDSHKVCPDSSVGLATGYGPDGRCSVLGKGKRFFFSAVSIPALDPTEPPV
jgi:hypothetical protein